MSFPMQPQLHGLKRHPYNTKLRLWWDAHWNGLPVQTAFGPLIENYLEKTRRVMDQALQAHSKILAVPLILHYPKALPSYSLLPHNQVISRFLGYLNWELGIIDTAHASDMRNIWCREQDTSDKPHYHAWLFFNGHALQRLGSLNAHVNGRDDAYDGDCLYHRIVRAWAWAINWPLEQMGGLVDVPKNNITEEPCVYHFHRDNHHAYQQVFYAASYSCKAYSKPIGQRIHCFDGSQL
ncbi:YagK/YfjJ domain-containing protein [Vreelandella titanicae]|uniref:YagK/YfjJ domain-containing protein n=1 Tax=Vreelandella titanicae TaxID=664683 RepID=UPI003D27FB03